jgi:hypothetical protein
MHEAQREEGVGFVARAHMRYAVRVANHVDWRADPRGDQASVAVREGGEDGRALA